MKLRDLAGKDQSDLVLVFGVIGILVVLFTPIPPGLLDLLLITNVTFALMILLLTFYVEKPLQFSTFPSLLLIATLFRLALNIAATRLILSDADGGQVIGAIGEHVVSGNYVIGMIVFLVLVVVQYVVVTNGAQRVAEVAARFTLDGMPGKQMSIDADLNMGLITEQQAQERRYQIEKEANFYGAMDGASKFVKGDAIAGIIIILIDIIGGLAIGIGQKGMGWVEAAETYTLLTIGDGIVTQIPALVIATGTGIIVTRAASDAFLSKEISKQITSYPKSLVLVAFALSIILFLPGMPVFPIVVVMCGLAGLTWWALVRSDDDVDEDADTDEADPEADIYDTLPVDPVEVQVGQNLLPMVGTEDSVLMERVRVFRKQFAQETGLVIPKIRVRDDRKLNANHYLVKVFGANAAQGKILPDRLLAIDAGRVREKVPGIDCKDPTYGLDARWIDGEARQIAKTAGYTVVEPLSVLMTHVSETLRREAPNLLTRSETEKLVNRFKTEESGLIEELIPSVMSYTDVQKVLQGLLREKVSIRNLQQILEVLVDAGKTTQETELLIEQVRARLGSLICQRFPDDTGTLNVMVLDVGVEKDLASSLQRSAEKRRLIVDPALAEKITGRIAEQSELMAKSNKLPVLLTAPELRRHLRQFAERFVPQLSVLSMAEVPQTVNVKSFAVVSA